MLAVIIAVNQTQTVPCRSTSIYQSLVRTLLQFRNWG